MRAPFRKVLPDGPAMPIRKHQTDGPRPMYRVSQVLPHPAASPQTKPHNIVTLVAGRTLFRHPASAVRPTGPLPLPTRPFIRKTLADGRRIHADKSRGQSPVDGPVPSSPAPATKEAAHRQHVSLRRFPRREGCLSDPTGISLREMSIPCAGDSAGCRWPRNRPKVPRGRHLSGRRDRGPWFACLSSAKCHDSCWSCCRIPGLSCQRAGDMGPWVGSGAPRIHSGTFALSSAGRDRIGLAWGTVPQAR